MRKAEAQEFYVAGLVWNIWADFWTGKVTQVPPLSFMRVGGAEDFIFISAVSEQDLDGFIQAVKATPDLSFRKHSDWWLPPFRWFGTWVVFAAQVRQAHFGIGRRIFTNDEVFDFEGSGDPRTTPLRPDRKDPKLPAE
jgi:hypothetical protein